MNGLPLAATIVGVFLLGAVLTALVGFPYAERRGYQRRDDEQRLYDGVALARDVHPIVEQALPEHDWPRWPDPRAEFRRVFSFRLRRPSWPRWDVLGVGPKVDAGLAAQDVSGRPASVSWRTDAPAGNTGGEASRITGSSLAPIRRRRYQAKHRGTCGSLAQQYAGTATDQRLAAQEARERPVETWQWPKVDDAALTALLDADRLVVAT